MTHETDAYIYESPDGGHTVYRRSLGSADRTLHEISDKKREDMENERIWFKWIEILRASRTDPHLKALIEQAEIYHQLKNSP